MRSQRTSIIPRAVSTRPAAAATFRREGEKKLGAEKNLVGRDHEEDRDLRIAGFGHLLEETNLSFKEPRAALASSRRVVDT